MLYLGLEELGMFTFGGGTVLLKFMLMSPPEEDWATPAKLLGTEWLGRVLIMSNPRPLKEARHPGLVAPERAGWDTSWGSTRDEGRVGDRVGIADLLTRTTFLKIRVLKTLKKRWSYEIYT